ncbi:RNA polymerase subunit RPABC4/transcription elongation factor Spt4 [Neorhizobium galegae]|nr:RNA polymerase subunit RPABC4/transcription elongation factor Spt4 [Neorhizobium galegae]
MKRPLPSALALTGRHTGTGSSRRRTWIVWTSNSSDDVMTCSPSLVSEVRLPTKACNDCIAVMSPVGPMLSFRSCKKMAAEQLCLRHHGIQMKVSLTKYACLACQRVFKRPADATQKTCPRCAGVTYRTGSDFRPPSADDKKGWEVASFLILSGFPYYRIGVRYPTTLKEARRFVEVNSSKTINRTTQGCSAALVARSLCLMTTSGPKRAKAVKDGPALQRRRCRRPKRPPS